VRVRKAVIPAAGLGTRFLPATKATPKEMLPLVDKPGIQYVVEEAVRAGITEILIITGRSKKSIEDHFDRSPELEAALERSGKNDLAAEVRALASLADICYIRQAEPRGLGHAVGLGRHYIGDEPFAVLLPDDLMAPESTVLSDMVSLNERTGSPVLALRRFPPEQISAYGVVALEQPPGDDGVARITSMVEKPPAAEAPSDLAIMGRYVLTPEIFGRIAALKPGAGGELQLTDAMAAQSHDVPYLGVVFDAGRFDTGNKLDWLRATVEVALTHPELGSSFRAALSEICAREQIT
jgi:UTP--glucose-1-phosphate uridylyltransferase